jgi:hypothetical protein
MSLVNVVRKKLLGKNLYNACKNRDPIVDNALLQKRLQYLQSRGLFPTFTVNDIIHICELKKKNVFAMDRDEPRPFRQTQLSGQNINITDEYFPLPQRPTQQEIKEEEEEEEEEEKKDLGETKEEEFQVVEQFTEDELADYEHKYANELIFLGGGKCMMLKVLNNLHRLLIMRNICFLQGAFVFADEHGKLFERLLHRCDYQYRRRFATITHDTFINPKEFDNRNKNSRLDKQFLRNEGIFYPEAINFKMYMYEVDIQDANRKHLEYNYACDEKCQENDSDKTRCPENIKESKKIVLMYPFQVDATLPNGEIIRKRYLYVKLEDDHAFSGEHAISATTAYIVNPFYRMLGYKEEKKKYPIRRERFIKSEVQYGQSLFPETDNQFYNALNVDLQEVLFYNTYIRNHYELFVPQNLTNSIIADIEPEESSDALP